MFVATRASILKNNSGDTCETFVFETRKSTKLDSGERNPQQEPVKREEKKKSGNVDLRKLRYEIIKFGSSGFEGSKKDESRIALAVSLGAKPPKRKGKNYKEILAEKKKEKDNLGRIKKQNASEMMFKKRERKWKGKRGKETKGLLKNYGKVKLKNE